MGMFRKEGGGFLNGETATIVGYTIDSKEFAGDNGAYHQMSVELLIKRDDADDPVQQFLGAGFLYPDREEGISDDGKTLVGGAAVSRTSEFGRFLQTLVEQRGEFEAEFSDDNGNATNFEPMVNYRVTFGKEINKDRQIAAGIKKLGGKKVKPASDGSYVIKGKSYTDAQVMEAGRRQDRNDKTKFYNHDQLIVTDVVGQAEGTKAAKVAAKAPVSTAAKSGKTNGAAKGEADYKATDRILLGLLTAALDSKLPLKSMNSVLVRKALEDNWENAERETYKALFTDPTYLGRENGWSFDGKTIWL